MRRVPLAELPDATLFGYGERLFRAGYFWEAHAVWEELWNAARAASPVATPESEALRAFIQLAAAALKQEQGNRAGSRKLLSAARSSLARAGSGAPTAEIRTRFERLAEAAGPGGATPAAGCQLLAS